jgi:hypothetical protein
VEKNEWKICDKYIYTFTPKEKVLLLRLLPQQKNTVKVLGTLSRKKFRIFSLKLFIWKC